MSQKRATQRRWSVHRTFEPDRLSPATLSQAYSQLVPAHIRVLRLPSALLATEPVLLNEQPPSKSLELITPEVDPSSVIEAITKQEAN